MSEYTNERPLDFATDLNLIREQCGTLELALQNETDPARLSDLRRELAECRQRAFEVEQCNQPAAEREAGGPAGEPLPPAAVRGDSEKAAPFVTIEAADPRPDYAGLYAAERIENAELRQELAAEGQGATSSSGGMERERTDPEISRLAELAEAHRTGVQMFGGIYGGGPAVPQAGDHSPALVELAEQHEARLLARDEAFSGEVVAQIERENESPAYVIEADGDRVMVPEVEGADMDVGDDVEISRDQQGNYEAEAGHDYGR
ncbi:MAG: hypothetical protein WC999_08935 [Hydrogenophaga sp.]